MNITGDQILCIVMVIAAAAVAIAYIRALTR